MKRTHTFRVPLPDLSHIWEFEIDIPDGGPEVSSVCVVFDWAGGPHLAFVAEAATTGQGGVPRDGAAEPEMEAVGIYELDGRLRVGRPTESGWAQQPAPWLSDAALQKAQELLGP